MTTRTCRVGVHGRNHEIFHDIDYQVIREARAEVVKMMSHTRPEVFKKIKDDDPQIEIITRLYDDVFGMVFESARGTAPLSSI